MLVSLLLQDSLVYLYQYQMQQFIHLLVLLLFQALKLLISKNQIYKLTFPFPVFFIKRVASFKHSCP